MKTLAFSFIFLWVGLSVGLAQKFDNHWITGIGTVNGVVNRIQFTNNYPDTSTIFANSVFQLGHTSLSDSVGNLLLYSNGNFIGNANFDTIANWFSSCVHPVISCQLTSGFKSYCASPHSIQHLAFIPFLKQKKVFAITPFHNNPYPSMTYCYRPTSLICMTIDLTQDNGLGAITQVNYLLNNGDSLSSTRVVTCKHSNGKDWWLLVNSHNKPRFYKFLFSSDTIRGPFIQDIGSAFYYDNKGQSAFSPDGRFFATATMDHLVDVYNFDRCNGELSLIETVTMPPYSYYGTWLGGCAFSANSRFLYIAKRNHVFQIDMLEDSLEATMERVASSNANCQDGGPPTHPGGYMDFSSMQLAPDGKIYIGTYDGCRFIHVINNPDLKGKNAINLVQAGLRLPVMNNMGMPSFPHYRMPHKRIFELSDPQLQHQINPGDSVTIGIADTVSVIEYEWLVPGTPGWSCNQMLLTVSPDTTTLFLYIRTDTSDTYSCNQRIDSIWVILPPCFALAACPVPPICAGDTAWLCASGDGSYLWSPPYNLHNAASGGTLAWPETTTVYTVTLTLGNGCTATDSVTVIVHQNSPPTFEDTTIRKGNPFGEFFPTADTTIRYHYLNQYGCDSTVYWEVRIDTLNSIDNGQLIMDNLAVFPNPVRGILYVKHSNPNAAFRLYNKLGQVVIEQQNLPPGTVVVSLRGLAEGVYFWEITAGGTPARGKVLLIH